MSYEWAAPLSVIENTNDHDVISAVILGDTDKSKLMGAPQAMDKPVIEEKLPSPKPKSAPSQQETVAIKPVTKNKLYTKSQTDMITKSLLDDIKTFSDKKRRHKKTAHQFQQMLKEQAEQTLRQQLLDEKIKLESAQIRRAQGQVNKYKALILQAISEHWLVPLQVNKKQSCTLMIRLAPGGMVLDVQVIKTSGDVALDRSARAAVIKASPLPVPSESDSFAVFKQFILKVKPENILSNERFSKST